MCLFLPFARLSGVEGRSWACVLRAISSGALWYGGKGGCLTAGGWGIVSGAGGLWTQD